MEDRQWQSPLNIGFERTSNLFETNTNSQSTPNQTNQKLQKIRD